MSLKEEIKRRRAAQTADGNVRDTTTGNSHDDAPPGEHEAVTPAPLFLRLVKLNRQCWLLPWASFHGAGFAPGAADGGDAGKCEHLRLIFMRHDVSVRGYKLRGVVDAIESFALGELCESSEKFHTAMNENSAPVVLALEIKVKTQ